MEGSEPRSVSLGVADLDNLADSFNLGPLREDWDDDVLDEVGSVATSFGSATREISDLDDTCAELSSCGWRSALPVGSDPHRCERRMPQLFDDDLSVDCDQMLQSLLSKLLLRQGLLEDHGRDGNNASLSLRDMRRMGALGDLSQDAQMTLLGSTLYEYNDQDIARQRRSVEARETNSMSSTVAHSQPEMQDAIRHSLSRIVSNLQTYTIHNEMDSLFSESSPACHVGSCSGENAQLNSFRPDSAVSGQSLQNGVTLGTMVSGVDDENVANLLFASESRTRSFGLGLEHAASISDVASDREEEDVVSVVGLDTPRSATSEYSIHQDQALMEETTSFAGLGDTIGSPLGNTTQSSSSGSISLFQGQQNPLRAGPGDSLSFEGLDGGLAEMLNRLSFDALSLDESLSRSMRRVMQIGTVLTGQHLTENEISALPKVRFDNTEQQNCAICLEAYQRGELLTSLSCDHFFHVDCLAGWFRRSTQCPLCRQSQGE